MLGMRNTTYVDPKKNDHIYFDHVVDERPEIAMVIEDGVGVEYKGQVGEEEVFEKYTKDVDISVLQCEEVDTEKCSNDMDHSVPLGDKVLAEKCAEDAHHNVQEEGGVTFVEEHNYGRVFKNSQEMGCKQAS